MNNDLTLYEIYQIVLVIDKKSLTEVSTIISIDKSTIRRNIRDIEKKIGCKLFETKGNQLIFTQGAHDIYNKYKVILNDYLTQINEFIRYKESTAENISILCQPEISLVLIESIQDIDLLNKVNIDFFGHHEIQDTDPKASALLLEQYDAIISVNDIYLLDEFNWLKLADVESKAIIYAHRDYIKDQVTPKELNDMNLYQSSIDPDEVTITYIDGLETKSEAIKLSPKISSDSLISNIHFASQGFGAVIVPEHFTKLIHPESGLQPIQNITLAAKPVNFYYKNDLSNEKVKTVKSIYQVFNS